MENDGLYELVCVAKAGIFSYIHETMRSLPDLAALFYAWTFAVDTFSYWGTETISSHETRSTDASQSGTAVRTFFCVKAVGDNVHEGQMCGFHNIGKAISGSTGRIYVLCAY